VVIIAAVGKKLKSDIHLIWGALAILKRFFRGGFVTARKFYRRLVWANYYSTKA
jgi:hypothetical protein